MNKVAIAKLYVNCSYPPTAIAASDTCQRPATSGVVSPETGNILYRCGHHEGKYDADTNGSVRYQVERQE